MNEAPQYVQLRRSDRAVEDQDWIAGLLQRAQFGMFAESVDGRPVAHTNLFAYDPDRHAIIFHTSDEGATFHNVTAHPQACFTAAVMGRLLPAHLARGFSVEYESVVAYGEIEVLSDPQEMTAALRLLMLKYAPHMLPDVDYRQADAEQLGGVAVYRMPVQRWSGKRKAASPDYPGAYRFPESGQPPAQS